MGFGAEFVVMIIAESLFYLDYVVIVLLLFGIDIFVGAIDEEGEEFYCCCYCYC